ncbi:exosortase N [Rufibacter sp. LB8]|uniref:exosortase N n=1 Tax=Rufibacter sp. LB8 TaxID=2777781 RepID=UPI00178C3186
MPLKLLLAAGFLLVAGITLRYYLQWNLPFLLAFALIPLVAQNAPRQAVPPVIITLTAVFIGLTAILKLNTIFYVAFLLAGWVAAQTLFGIAGRLPLLLLLVSSPIFVYVTDIWSFPLRLKLSGWAAQLLSPLYKSATSQGNLILLNGQEFSVDPACAGLSMLSFSLLLAVAVLAQFQKQYQFRWAWWELILMLLCMVLLNVASNLIRIVLLVQFKIMPQDALHEIMGLLCLLVYAVVPFYAVAKWLAKRQRQHKLFPQQPPASSVSRAALALNFFLLAGLTFAGYQVLTRPTVEASPLVQTKAGFTVESMPNNVQKWTNGEMLVYLKSTRRFYTVEHHPFICWQGSGYEFTNVQQQVVANKLVYLATLNNGTDTLYTAWWMDNGQQQTIDQLDWRWRMLKGEPPYYLVNITAATSAKLEASVKAWQLSMKQ